MAPNWERGTLRVYIVTLLFNFYAEYIMQNARVDESCHKLQSRFLGEISITSDMHWIEFPSSGDQ